MSTNINGVQAKLTYQYCTHAQLGLSLRKIAVKDDGDRRPTRRGVSEPTRIVWHNVWLENASKTQSMCLRRQTLDDELDGS